LFIISDFYSSDFSKPLKILRNKNDVIAINISDLREKEIPEVGLIQLEDEETGEQLLVDTSDLDFRKGYTKLVNEVQRKLNFQLRKMKIDTINILTNEPYDIPLKRFFKIRKQRVVR